MPTYCKCGEADKKCVVLLLWSRQGEWHQPSMESGEELEWEGVVYDFNTQEWK